MTVAQLRRKLENMDPNIDVEIMYNQHPGQQLRAQNCIDVGTFVIDKNSGIIILPNSPCSSSSINSRPMIIEQVVVIY